MFKDAPVQFNYYSMVEARALVTNYYQPTRARRLWRHYLSFLTGGAGSFLLTVVFYPLFSRRMDTRCPDSMKTCCYDQELDLGAAGVTCVSPEMSSDDQPEEWSQHCPKKEPMMSSRDQCGLRQFHNNEGDIR